MYKIDRRGGGGQKSFSRKLLKNVLSIFLEHAFWTPSLLTITNLPCGRRAQPLSVLATALGPLATANILLFILIILELD